MRRAVRAHNHDMRRTLFVLLLAASAPAAAGPPSAESAAAALGALTGQAPAVPDAVPTPTSAPAPPSSWTGSFRVVYGPAAGAEAKKWKRILQKTKVLDQAAAGLTRQLYLSSDLVIEAKECGEANAWYDPGDRRITFCYDYPAEAARLLASRVEPASRARRLALGSVLHTFYHETGHALIDIYSLPAVGREEDAVDQFATLVLLSSDEGEAAAVAAAMEFLQGSSENRRLRFWDEHSFDKVRYYDTLCLIYGKDPAKHEDLVEQKILPKDRALRCEDEYRKLDAAWDKLLEPYLKPEAAGRAAGDAAR